MRRSSVVSLGQAWWMLARRSVLEGLGSKGLRRPCAGLGLPVIPFANFGAQKNLGFSPLLKMPKDWREGVLLAFSGCGVGDGEQRRQITRCRASGRFCAAGSCG